MSEQTPEQWLEEAYALIDPSREKTVHTFPQNPNIELMHLFMGDMFRPAMRHRYRICHYGTEVRDTVVFSRLAPNEGIDLVIETLFNKFSTNQPNHWLVEILNTHIAEQKRKSWRGVFPRLFTNWRVPRWVPIPHIKR